ncbi:MAG: radical SAM protein [Candidatus Micrarchaeota archaeon]|nr:radical SAM protein [Candidatus Micrarchaeota archaeon]
MILVPRPLQQKPRISTVVVTTKCENSCRHCAARNSDGSFRYEQMHMKRDVLEAAIGFGRFKDVVELAGGNPLLYRDGEMGIGDLALELKTAGVKRLAMTVFPFHGKDEENIAGMMSLSKVAAHVELWISFNAFGVEGGERINVLNFGYRHDGKQDPPDMQERMRFTINAAMEAGIRRILPAVRVLPSNKDLTFTYLPYGEDAARLVEFNLVTGIGRGVDVWREELARMGNDAASAIKSRLYGCLWDGKTLTVMPDGALVPGCRSAGCLGVPPFPATIFDSVGMIREEMEAEYGFARGLKGTIDFYPCEVHARRMPME